MTKASRSIHFGLLLGLAFASACVDTGRNPDDNTLTGGDSSVKMDMAHPTTPMPDLSMPPRDFSGPMCVTQCFTDGDCQNSCAAPSSGINCCDTTTNTCFVSQDQVCPSPQNNSDMGPY